MPQDRVPGQGERAWLQVILDATPVVGTAKGLVELFTGDLIPDKEPYNRARQTRLAS